MKKSTVGFFLLILLGVAAVVTWKVLLPSFREKQQTDSSDASKTLHTLRIGGDNYLGYWFIGSPEMRKQAARRGLQTEFTDDGGAYAERLEKFNREEYDCIVLPVNSYLQHGVRYDFPGVITAAISESRGADGIVGFGDRLPTGKINELNDPSLKIVFTPDSPSSFLLDLTIADFDLQGLQSRREWQVSAEGSAQVYKKAKKGEGDVFVLWEPDLSRSLQLPGMKYIWGSDKFSGYIIDVFVFHRKYLDRHADVVKTFFQTYFQVLMLYGNNRERLVAEMSKSIDLKADTVEPILEKIDWFDLGENCEQQFGIPVRPGASTREGVINTIIACTDVMRKTGKFSEDPLKGNPYRITNRTILEDLSRTEIAPVSGRQGGPEGTFASLSDAQWGKLREVGTFRVEPITFQSWNNLLTPEGKELVDKIAALLINNYPNYRIIIRGHTGPGGDEEENLKLSKERAQIVGQYLQAVHGIAAGRIRSEGAGSNRPAKRRPGESERSFQYRLSRVEFIAVEAGPL